jgi:NAD(P)-dependent dehydrogenase (short-subunit alcohol dehydrogenase family)
VAQKGKIALVTGAGSGIGKAVALGMARVGYTVVGAGRSGDALQAVVEEAGAGMAAVPTDLTDAFAVAELFATIQRRFGRLDVLFNNAGINAPAIPLEDLSPDQWKSVIDINVSGAFYCIQQAFRLMKQQDPQGGRIINNGSISASAPRPNSAPYTASKHAVSGLTKATALDGRRYNIACGQIDIGNAATPMAAEMPRGVLQADLSVRPEPTLDVAHVVDAVLYMASLPLDANVQWLTVMATKMPYVGRG